MAKNIWEIKFISNFDARCLDAMLYINNEETSSYSYDGYEDSTDESKECYKDFLSILQANGCEITPDDTRIMREQISGAFTDYENGERSKFRQFSTVVPTSDSVQDIINNTCFFSKYQIDLIMSRVTAGAKKLVPGIDRIPKNISLLTASGKKYYAKINRIEVLEKATKKEVSETFSSLGTNAFIVFESYTKSHIVALSLGYIGDTDDKRATDFYEFKENKVYYVDDVPTAFYFLAKGSVHYDFNSPLTPTLLPIMEYYNLLQVELNKKSENTRIAIDMETLRSNYDVFLDLAVDENLIVVPVIGKAERIRSISLQTETYTNYFNEYDFYDGSLTTISKEDKESYLESLDEDGVVLPSNTDLALIDLINVSERDIFLFRKIFADSSIKNCIISTNIKGDKVRLDRVTAGIKSALSGDVVNSRLVNTICQNDISFLDKYNSDDEYVADSDYISYLKKEYPILEKNEEQLIAIDKILQMDKKDIDIMLVQGPPGTGKTELILALAKELYKSNYNTLITSNVHVACDNIVDRLKNNKDLVLKRYTAIRGDQYLKELVENKKKYVENQVLEGFKFNDIIVDSVDAYKEIRTIVEQEKIKKETILQSKNDYDSKLKPYYELVETLTNLRAKADEIENSIVDSQEEISKLSDNAAVINEKISKTAESINASNNKKITISAELDSAKQVLTEKTNILSDLYAANTQNELLVAEKNKYIASLSAEIDSLLTAIQAKEERASYVKTVSEEDIKAAVLAFVTESKEIADSRLKKLIPNTLKCAIELSEIYRKLKEDYGFWNSSANADFKTIEYICFKSKGNGIIKEILNADTIEKLEDTYTFLKASNAKHNLMSVLPFVKINGKNKAYYENCLQQINNDLKRIQINCADFIMPHVLSEASNGVLQESYASIINEIGEHRCKIKENELIIEKENELIFAISEEQKQTKERISFATNDLWETKQRCAELEESINKTNEVISDLQIESKELSRELELIAESTSQLNNDLNKLKTLENTVQEDININNAKIKVLEVELGSLITNYDSFIAKMNIDIKDIDKKLDKYSSVLERIESKINELTATGWTHEEAEIFISNYAKELYNISDCDSQIVEQLYFTGRGNEFNKMFLLDDNSDASLISMTTNQIATLLKSADKNNLTFDYAIIDEASKCRFEDLIISLPRIKHLVLIGDFMQLDPMYDNYSSIDIAYQNIFSQDGWDSFNKSSFGMLLSQFVEENMDNGTTSFDNNPYIAVMKRQYRMNKGIFNLIKPVYDIHEGFELIDEKKNSANDVKCINTNGKELSMLTSYYNIEEADAIIAFITELKQRRSDYPNIKSIGIITGYKAQENYLRRQLKKLKIKGVQLGTFDRFQGREYDLVIISLVRTEKFGFTNNVRRMNVAFSRAKNHLLVFGNFDKLNKLALKGSKALDSDSSSVDAKENDFVLKTLIPKLYSLREDFVSKEDCVNELLDFLKENDYE